MHTCQHCKGAIPEGLRSTTLYCSRLCKSRAAHLRKGDKRKEYDERYRAKCGLMTKAEREKLRKQKEREAITARHLKELEPVTQRYEYRMHQRPYLGHEYNIY